MPVYVIDTLKPKNGLDFPVVEAVDVAVEGYSSLADAVTHFVTDTAINAINAALILKANSADVTESVANLQGQIDQIAQTAGTGTADTEIGQARVGADGTSYTTLKERLDAENEDTQENIETIADVMTIAQDGYYVGAATSHVVDASDACRTVYAKCEPNKKYTVTKTATKRFSVFFTAELPTTGVATSDYTTDNEASKIEAVSPATAQYICAYCYNTNTDSNYGTATEVMNSVQITTLSAHDAQCRANLSAVSGKVDSCKTLINENFGYVNYGYDTPYHRDANPESSSSLKIGVNRNNEIITLNGDSTSNPYNMIVVKINGDIVTTNQQTTISGWNSGISLISGHTYKITNKLLSGISEVNDEEFVNSISVYPIGQRSSVGTYTRSGKTFERTFTATDTQYNFCIYIGDEQTFVNAKFLITLEDLTDGVAPLTKADEQRVFDYFDEVTNDETNLINYGYTYNVDNYPSTGTQQSATFIGVERYGTNVKLNLNTSSYSRRVKISGEIERDYNSKNYKSWTNSLYLDEGKKYIVTVEKISGTGSLNGEDYFPNAVVYDTPIANSISSWLYQSTTKKQFIFTAGSTPLSIALYSATGASFTDLIVRVTLTRADSDIEPYYTAEMNDTVNKVRDALTAPALVFPIVTDIHRYSSNATVQNFKQMIDNISHLASEVKLDFLLNLGDLTDGDTTQAVTLDRAYDSTADFVNLGIPYFYANGNHDINYYGTNHQYQFTTPEIFKAYYGSIKDVVYNKNEYATDYYIDFTIGVRLICLNANSIEVSGHDRYAFGNSTATWLESALDTNNTVIVALHQSSLTNQVYDNVATYNRGEVNDALQTFVNNGGTLIMLSGHSHRDIAFIDPWISVMQDCQRFTDTEGEVIPPTAEDTHGITDFIDNIVKWGRTAGTYTEDAWTVCIYKPDAHDLDFIRFGAGADRHFHVQPISPTTVTTKLSGTITWSSSNEEIATVTDGVITSVSAGKCAIIAKDENNNYECWIVVVEE